MVNQLVFNSAPALFDTAYQLYTWQYGKQGASTPAQNIMGKLYQYTAPSRWAGSVKSLLPGYTFSLPWDENNPGLTGNSNLDGVFDILVGKGIGDSTRLNNFKDKVNNTVKQSLKKPIADILYAPSYLKKDRNSNNNVYGVANRYYIDRYNDNGIPANYPYQFRKGLTEKLYKNISKRLSSLQENFYKDDDDIIANIDEHFKYSPMESLYLHHLMDIGAVDRLRDDTGVNFSKFLHDPSRFMKVYEDKLKFKDYLSKHPSLGKNINLFSTSYNKNYRDYGIGTVTASDELKDFINNIQLKKDDLGTPYAKILDFNPDDVSSYLGYPQNSTLFGGFVDGLYYPGSGRSIVKPSTEANLMSTLLHESYSHRTDEKIGITEQKKYDLSKYLKNPIHEGSKSWYESRATMNELAFKLWKDFGKPDLNTFRQYIDNMSEDNILDVLENINGYSQDYVRSVRKNPGERLRMGKEIKYMLKYLPIATAPIMLRKPNNNDKQ